MESEPELAEPSSTPRLPLFSIPPPPPPTMKSPERSGTVTPPLHTSASVPFRWEEEPGKPLPCTALVTAAAATLSFDPKNSGPKCLELPPRLQLLDQSKMTKMPSPTTVLDGPCNNNVGIYSVLQSSSMRLKRERQGSLFCTSIIGSPDQGDQFVEMVLRKERGGFLGSWAGKKTSALLKRGNKKKDVGEGSFVFSSPWDLAGFAGDGNGGSARMKMSRIKSDRSISGLPQAKSHFWAAVYEGFKQVLPWSKKSKKEGLII